MKLSKKTEYGLRFLLALAELNAGRFMGIYQISLRHHIPMKFLEAIAVSLKKEGLLEVKKGAGGGYCLKLPAHEISLLQVYECLEGNYKNELEIKEEDNSNKKAVYILINQVKSDMHHILASKTLADIQREYKNLNDSLMYYI